jgi:hypothetical protein
MVALLAPKWPQDPRQRLVLPYLARPSGVHLPAVNYSTKTRLEKARGIRAKQERGRLMAHAQSPSSQWCTPFQDE